MAQDVKPRIRIPAQVKPGEVFEVKALVTHDMESGQRRDAAGALVPRRIINRLTCAYNGRPVFDAALEPAVAANPYVAFFLKATESGFLDFAWTDDDGTVYRARQAIKVG
ncbi:MAG: thiosulfate oxidation carrier complex protein SoxZ [Alphaproteobacteria bacterium]|nr:thiosulfate oxidation carrier complex protein SoxZ [Alphaproteobacteria bacterium]